MEKIYNSPEYKRSRKAYISQCTFEYLVTIFVSGVYLANLLSHMGLSDALTGIISSFISFAFLFQLLSIFLVKKLTNTKRTVIILNCLSPMLFICMYLTPFMPFSSSTKSALVILFILFSYAANYMVRGVLFKWGNSFVDPAKRAEYSAGKEIVSLISGIAATLTVGHIIDLYAERSNVQGGFLFIAATILIFNICNFISLLLIKNDNTAAKTDEHSLPLKIVLKNTLGNKNFLSVIAMTALWNISQYMILGFMGTFEIKDLAISVGTMQIINTIGHIARILVSKPFGRFSDKTSYATGIRWAFAIVVSAYLVNVFTTPQRWWLIIIYTILYNISLAGLTQNFFNITYSYVDDKYIVQAMAINSSISGICGFLASLAAGKLLTTIQNNGNMVFGLHIYGQQLLSAISVLILIFLILYMHFVIEKQEVKIQ